MSLQFLSWRWLLDISVLSRLYRWVQQHSPLVLGSWALPHWGYGQQCMEMDQKGEGHKEGNFTTVKRQRRQELVEGKGRDHSVSHLRAATEEPASTTLLHYAQFWIHWHPHHLALLALLNCHLFDSNFIQILCHSPSAVIHFLLQGTA